MEKMYKNIPNITNYSQLSPCGHPAIADVRYYGQNPDPRQSYGSLTGNDSHYYGISDTFLVQSDNFIVLTLDTADTLYFSYNINM